MVTRSMLQSKHVYDKTINVSSYISTCKWLLGDGQQALFDAWISLENKPVYAEPLHCYDWTDLSLSPPEDSGKQNSCITMNWFDLLP